MWDEEKALTAPSKGKINEKPTDYSSGILM
jgi:hypothetical protein